MTNYLEVNTHFTMIYVELNYTFLDVEIHQTIKYFEEFRTQSFPAILLTSKKLTACFF